MRVIILLLLCFVPGLLASAQPGDMGPPLEAQYSFGFYTNKGKLITPESKGYQLSIRYEQLKDGLFTEPVSLSKATALFSDNRFQLTAAWGKMVHIEIRRKRKKMQIETLVSNDSIVFTPGSFRFEGKHSGIFHRIKPHNGARIIERDIANYRKGSDFTVPVAGYFDELPRNEEPRSTCRKFAKPLEEHHGGLNWLLNVCNDRWQAQWMSKDREVQKRLEKQCTTEGNELRVKIYPFKQTSLLKHEFFLEDAFVHHFSISKDNGITWQRFISITGEWYVSMVYFSDEDKIGIITQDRLLVSDAALTNWNYYDLTAQRIKRKDSDLFAFVMRNENWFDTYCTFIQLNVGQ